MCYPFGIGFASNILAAVMSLSEQENNADVKDVIIGLRKEAYGMTDKQLENTTCFAMPDKIVEFPNGNFVSIPLSKLIYRCMNDHPFYKLAKYVPRFITYLNKLVELRNEGKHGNVIEYNFNTIAAYSIKNMYIASSFFGQIHNYFPYSSVEAIGSIRN